MLGHEGVGRCSRAVSRASIWTTVWESASSCVAMPSILRTIARTRVSPAHIRSKRISQLDPGTGTSGVWWLRTLRPGCPASTASSPPPPASSPLPMPPSAAPRPSSAQPPPPHSPSAATASGSALPVFSLPPAPSWAVPRPRQALRGLAWAGLWRRTGGLRVWFGRRSRRPWRRSAARSAAAPAASRGSPRQALPR